MTEFVDEMDELLDGLDCRLRVSGMVADSIMMGIVNSTMEEAFQKACSTEGSIERLNEKTRFCELAVMQLEWCLKFVLEETDNYVVLDTSCERERLVSELTETRDRMQRRLHETEFAISEKDRELMERFDIELKLRQALEVKDRELRSLRRNLNEHGKTKSDGVQELGLSSRMGVDESIDDDICELKNSVDQQFLNIKQKLEDERMSFTSGMRKMSQGQSSAVNTEPDSQLVYDEESCDNDEKRSEFDDNDCEFESLNCSLKPQLNAGFQKMGSDIDVLKETLDLAFGLMDNAISLSEVGPMEQQWRWSIEKDTVTVVLRGFLRDVQDKFGARVRGAAKQTSLVLMESWSELMNEITSLHHELDNLMEQVRTTKHRESMSPPALKDVADKVFSRRASPSRGKTSPEASSVSSALDRYGKPPNNTGSSKIKEQDLQEEQYKEDPAGQVSLVAEMIRNHETIIRQKSAESKWLKVEVLREKGCLSKKDTEPDTLMKMIQDIVFRLDSIIKVNAEMDQGYDDVYVHENDSVNSNFTEEIRLLKQEKEFSSLASMLQDEIYTIVFKGLVKEHQVELFKYGVESLIREDVSKVFLSEMVKEWNEDLETYYVESHLREDICQLVLCLASKDNHSCLRLTKFQVDNNEDGDFLRDSPLSNDLLLNIEGQIRENVLATFLREMVKEWKEDLESYHIDSHIREEIHQIVFCEVVKDRCLGLTSTQFQTDRNEKNILEGSPSSNELFQNLEGLIREDLYKVFLREMFKEWNHAKESYDSESRIRADVDHIVFHEPMSASSCTHSFTSTGDQRSRTQDTFVEDLSVDRFLSLEGKIKEDVHADSLCHMDTKLKDLENYTNERLVEEEIYQIVFHEVLKEMKALIKFTLNECQEAKDQVKSSNSSKLLQTFETQTREDVCKLVFREMVKEWKKEIESHSIESLISEHIHQIVIGEAVKDIKVCLTKHQGLQNGENSTTTNKLIKGHEFHGNESLLQNLVSLSKCFELEEDLILCARDEFMEWNMHIDGVNVNHERLDQCIPNKRMLVQKEALGSVVNKLESVLQQITTSKAYLEKVKSSIGIAVGNIDDVNGQMTPVDTSWLSSVFTTISKFSRETADFENMVQEKLGLNNSRLEDVIHKLQLQVEHLTLLRKRKSLYKKAFFRRCYDLQKAENEVDLLGDEVDALVSLLEKIYRTLLQYSPVLQQNFDIMEIVQLIKKELSRPAASTSEE